MNTVSGEAIDVLPAGTAVRHKEHHNLTGEIQGVSRPLRLYRVWWDNPKLALATLGPRNFYQGGEDIEPRPAQDDIDVLFP